MTSTSKPASSASNTLDRQIAHGYDLLRARSNEDALSLASELVDSHPGAPKARDFAAEVHLATGNPGEALEQIDQAIAASGGDPYLMIKKARLLPLLRRRSEVAALAADIAARADGNGSLLWQLGKLYYRNNLQSDAIRQFERARALLGDHPGLLYDMAVARFFSGDFEQAERDLDRTLSIAPQSGPSLYLRATLRRQTPERNHVPDLERRLKAGFRNPRDQAAALYGLGKELEDLGEHDRSFETFSLGARTLRGSMPQYDVSSEIAAMQAIMEAYSADVMSADDDGCDEPGAIFIVGMPRTGTTLAERLFAQSGKVAAAGELLDFGNLLAAATQRIIDVEPGLAPATASLRVDFAALGRDYLRGINERSSDVSHFIDKMPVNFMYCGMIRKALPNAKIIHLRRDPLDTCYAVFKTLFFNSYSFSYDLHDLAEYYVAYSRMMQHWHDAMPGSILDVTYEDLVSDTERQSQRMYEWCGLDWSAEVLDTPAESKVFATASAAQVREPVHRRSVGSASRHRERMAPLLDKLAAAGLIDRG